MKTQRKFAEGTTVSVTRSRMEIEQSLTRYGASSFASGWDDGRRVSSIMFTIRDRRVRFEISLPDPKGREFTRDGRGAPRSPSQQQAAYDAELRRIWRSLALVIKAKLEAVSSGVTTFDDEFLAHLVTGDGRTIGQALKGAIDQIASGERPLLPEST